MLCRPAPAGFLSFRQGPAFGVLAAIEASTFAPILNFAPGFGPDAPDTSAREAIISAVNDPRGVNS